MKGVNKREKEGQRNTLIFPLLLFWARDCEEKKKKKQHATTHL